MEIRLLRAFLTVAELRHFGRAADALALSQPALSKQIVALEESVGARLFERGRHGAELTSFGAAFLADAQSLVRDADAVLARAREASRQIALALADFCAAIDRGVPAAAS